MGGIYQVFYPDTDDDENDNCSSQSGNGTQCYCVHDVSPFLLFGVGPLRGGYPSHNGHGSNVGLVY